jgi:hypothetical protein
MSPVACRRATDAVPPNGIFPGANKSALFAKQTNGGRCRARSTRYAQNLTNPNDVHRLSSDPPAISANPFQAKSEWIRRSAKRSAGRALGPALRATLQNEPPIFSPAKSVPYRYPPLPPECRRAFWRIKPTAQRRVMGAGSAATAKLSGGSGACAAGAASVTCEAPAARPSPARSSRPNRQVAPGGTGGRSGTTGWSRDRAASASPA